MHDISGINLNYKEFPNDGLPDNVSLNENIWEKSIRYKSKFADKIVEKYYDNSIFLEYIDLDSMILFISNNSEVYDSITNISLGNLSYISLYSPEPFKSKAHFILNSILYNENIYEKYITRHTEIK